MIFGVLIFVTVAC